MASRGQVQQVFLILFAVIVIIATIYLSIKLLGGLTQSACEANDVALMRSIQSTLEENSAFGSRNEVAVSATCNALELCFVDSGALGQDISTSDAVIRASVKNNVQTNIFLRAKDSTVPVGFAQSVILRKPSDPAAKGIVCAPARSGKFIFSTEGYGRSIMISP
jgi:hypothetical protein